MRSTDSGAGIYPIRRCLRKPGSIWRSPRGWDPAYSALFFRRCRFREGKSVCALQFGCVLFCHRFALDKNQLIRNEPKIFMNFQHIIPPHFKLLLCRLFFSGNISCSLSYSRMLFRSLLNGLCKREPQMIRKRQLRQRYMMAKRTQMLHTAPADPAHKLAYPELDIVS